MEKYIADDTRLNYYSTSNPANHLPEGRIAYYLENSNVKPGQKEICFGIVESHENGNTFLRLIEPADRRKINGIPVRDFVTPTKWKKLPKDWSWNTVLFQVTTDPQPDLPKYDIANPDSLLKAYQEGILVDVEANDHAVFEDEIDRQNGWRIVRRYPYPDYHPSYVSVKDSNIFADYTSAKIKMDAFHAELFRQASLSDYDWAVEQIDNAIECYSAFHHLTDAEKSAYREYLLSQDNVEDIEVRYTSNGLQWKYETGKKWYTIQI